MAEISPLRPLHKQVLQTLTGKGDAEIAGALRKVRALLADQDLGQDDPEPAPRRRTGGRDRMRRGGTDRSG